MTTIEQSGVTWINILHPTKEKIEAVSKLVKLHPMVKQGLLLPTFRAKLDPYDALAYLVLHFPVYDEETKIAQPQEIDFVITQKTLISAHYKEIPALHELVKELEAQEILRKKLMRLNTVRLFYEIILRLFTLTTRELAHIEEKVSQIEKDIFADKQKEMVRLISFLRSDIINFSRAMKPLKPVFAELQTQGISLFGKQWGIYFTTLSSEYRKVMNIVETQSQAIRSLQATNDSLLSFHINQFLKILAIINLLVVPIVIIESIIGIRWYLQEITGAFPAIELIIAVLIAALMDLLLLLFFYYKKWL